MQTVLFDLDGTLLPMNQDLFIELYFKSVFNYFSPYGFEPKILMNALNKGTYAMITNDGSCTNEDRFWSIFNHELGEQPKYLKESFLHYYETAFIEAKSATVCHPLASQCIRLLKDKGYQVIIATNPVFPKIATYTRIGWAGICLDDVSYITTYETCSFCKPNLKYYEEITKKMMLNPEECLMVGNDVAEDMCAAKLGMETFLITDCLRNQTQQSITEYPHGSMESFYEYIKKMPFKH